MIARSALLSLVVVCLAAGGAWAQAPWKPELANPRPAADDLTLPLPCGGAIVFRPVAVPVGSGALDDRAIQLGDPDAELGFNEFQRGTFLAAPFSAGTTRVFYLGKYDITEDQYAAVMGACPTPSLHGRAARSMVSWFEAVDFTQRLSSWLLANAVDKLPKRGSAVAFVRLPTEAEWEYAARGGTAVSETDYLAPTWPMPEGAERYAIAGAEMSDGKAQQVGQLLPNPLGLYDMLGNVEQWVLDAYHLNRVGRAQGQPGGLVVRGGSYATALEELRTSMRTEIPPFDAAKKAPTRLAFVGFRVTLSTVAGGGLQDVDRLRKAFVALHSAGSGDGSDPRARIEQLKQLTADQTLRRALDSLSAQLAADERARVDTEAQAVRADLNAATALCYVVWRVQRLIMVQQSILSKPEFQGIQSSDEIQRVRAAIALNQTEQQTALNAYAELLRQIIAGGGLSTVAAQAEVVTQEMTARADRRRGFVAVAVRHLTSMGGSHPPLGDAMLKDIVTLP